MDASNIWEIIYNPLALSTLAVILTVTYVWKQQHHNCGYPPGPFNFPLLGNLPQAVLSGSMVNFLRKNQRKFGNAFTAEFGGHRRVVISGYDDVYQLLVKNADFTSNRSTGSLSSRAVEITKQRPGLLFAPFPLWKIMRSFALNVLRDEGMGKATIEPKIHEEVHHFCKYFIDTRLGQPIDLCNDIPKATYNIISELIFGGRRDYNSKEMNFMIQDINQAVEALVRDGIYKNLPILRTFLIGSSGMKYTPDLIQKHIDEHRSRLDPNHPKDIIDEYLIYQQSLGNEKAESEYMTDGNLKTLAIQLYVAGTETTSTSLRWALLYTAYYPDVMENVCKEIEAEIGLDKEVSTSDRSRMLYVNAVLLETLRIANVIPTSLPHLLEQDYTIDGKVIPAGSDLMVNMASILYDEQVFEEPLKFKPTRYLTGDVALKKKRTIPFSLGRRVCLGESLARMEFFLLYVTLIQRYNIRLAEDSSFKIQASKFVSAVNAPIAYKLTFTKKQ